MLMRKENTNWSKWMNKRASSFWNEQYQIAPPLNHVWHFISVYTEKFGSHPRVLGVLLQMPMAIAERACQLACLGTTQTKRNEMWWFWSTLSFLFSRFFFSSERLYRSQWSFYSFEEKKKKIKKWATATNLQHFVSCKCVYVSTDSFEFILIWTLQSQFAQFS